MCAVIFPVIIFQDSYRKVYKMASATKELLVYEQIKTDLLNHSYEPGFQMIERTLTDKYKVSRSPVRCALRLLVKDGLLRSDPSGRIFVPEYTLEDILEIYDLIEVLQDYAVRIFMKNPCADVPKELEQILEGMEKAAEAKSYPVRMDYDNRFHLCIINSAKNSRLTEIFTSLINQKKMFDHRSYYDAEHALLTNAQHRKIYEAVRDRNLEGTLSAIKEHEQYIKKYYVDILILSKHNL